ncbi:DUF4280 domain-containing protein [Ningiella sp. W23]|uniref:DUF4280 domain-containing protein n=1 Tax=Ningiella sp. W23 TaxID=3023715 RepID=UPI0037579757
MPEQVIMGAKMLCSQGMAPSTLIVPPLKGVSVEGMAAATVNDKIPIVNIPPFGLCRSMSNPQVAAATSAAMGTLTPMPCIPVIAGPWKPGAKKTAIGGVPCLTKNSKCTCAWGGSISIVKSGGKITDVA